MSGPVEVRDCPECGGNPCPMPCNTCRGLGRVEVAICPHGDRPYRCSRCPGPLDDTDPGVVPELDPDAPIPNSVKERGEHEALAAIGFDLGVEPYALICMRCDKHGKKGDPDWRSGPDGWEHQCADRTPYATHPGRAAT